MAIVTTLWRALLAVIAGLALAALLANLSFSALSPLNGSYVGISLMFAAIALGVPLFLITLAITIYLAAKSALGPLLAMVMWLPVLASMAIIPMSESSRKTEAAAYASSHPKVREIHVNLTGRDLRLDPVIGEPRLMEGDAPASFLNTERDPESNRGDKMAAYRGVLLAPDFKSMPVIYGSAEKGEATLVPVVVAPSPAAWAPFLPQLGTSLGKVLVHFYYHYPDHVEVASVIEWDDRHEPDRDNGSPASRVLLHNLTSENIVRLEVNGETVLIYEGLTPLQGQDCRVIQSTAVIGAAPKLTVRWQTAQSAPIWSEATAALPSFRTPIPDTTITPISVHVFLQQDGSAAVQLAQTYEKLYQGGGVRVTEPLPAFKTPPACGDADDRYPLHLERSPDMQ